VAPVLRKASLSTSPLWEETVNGFDEDEASLIMPLNGSPAFKLTYASEPS
jgi:hypothetical protein